MALPPDARLVGLDLAWGERSRTGVAVLDGDGRLLLSGSAVTDDEVAGLLASAGALPGQGGTVVAAVDAPLVVPNETGRRPCEATVAALFARHHAGPHPANRGNPAFRPEPRAARLARRFGWDPDPAVRPAPGRRTCVEVYPHPAMVSLFGLDRVIRYKAKRGRSLEALRAEHVRLQDELERLCGEAMGLGGSPRWAHLRREVASSRTKAGLRCVEDEVDAVFCAHLALLWATRPGELVVHGDVRSGYIVTPPPPAAGHPPADGRDRARRLP